MFCCRGKINLVTIEEERIGELLEVERGRLTGGGKGKKLCLLSNKSYMVLFTVLHSKVEKSIELYQAVRHKDSVVCLTNGGDHHRAQRYAKSRLLGCCQLNIVAKFVNTVRIYSPLFNP